MLAKVNDTPAGLDQLDLLLQPMYTQSYTRQNKETSLRGAVRSRGSDSSKAKAILPPD